MTGIALTQTALYLEQSSLPPNTAGFFAFLPRTPSTSRPDFLALSWQNWLDCLRHTAQRLLDLGATRGKPIAYVGANKWLASLVYFAAIKLDCPILLVNPAFSSAQQAALRAHYPIDFWCNEAVFEAPCSPLPACYEADQHALLAKLRAERTTLATLTLTSGSSGVPKAVAHSQAQHIANARGVIELMAFHSTDCWLLSLPLFHVSGQGILWRWLTAGATLCISENKARFFDALAGCSHASLVPLQLQRYLDWLGEKPAPKQHLLLGGMHLPANLIQQTIARGITPYSGYGMTEMASTICAEPNATNSVGRALAGREVKLVGGEIWLRGGSLALGYWQADGALLSLANDEGWFASGDRGAFTDEGNLQVLGRKDNLFISGGENIQPETLEKAFVQAGLVEQIFILPVREAEFGARPVALYPDSESASGSQLRAFAEAHFAPYQRPIGYFRFSPAAFQNGIKLARRSLAEYAEQCYQSAVNGSIT